MAKKYVVARGRSIQTTDFRHLTEGTILTEESLAKCGWPKDRVALGVRNGFLIEFSEQAMASLLGDGIPSQSVESAQEGRLGNPPWNYNPDALQKKTLEQLNALILGEDSNVPPFTTPEEATAFLSQTFKKPEGS